MAIITLLALVQPAPRKLAAAERRPAPEVTFEQHVRPILKANCFHCHGEGQENEGGLDLRLRRWIVAGGDSGAGLAPGKPADSLLLTRIVDGEMPPAEVKKRLTRAEIATIRRWIEAGAPTKRPEPTKIDGMLITEEERNFWAFRPVVRNAPPAVQADHRVRTPIDRFLLAKLEARQLSFGPDAERLVLLRRATFDLLGLPPTPAQQAEFLSDQRPGAYERLLDRLLASPRYGERWGRHWLDVAGYADSEGHTDADTERAWAFKYRDYVIEAFNRDLPYDQFVREQLAGDELVSSRKNFGPTDIQKLAATGFLRMAPDGTATVNTEAARNATVADTIEIVSKSLLGLTVNCAQCHNHRYDPIPQADYYRLRAIFDPALNWRAWKRPPQRLISLYTDAQKKQAAEIEKQAKAVEAERSRKQAEYIAQTLKKELAKLPAEIRDAVKQARDTPAKKRTPAQKKLLRDHPSVNVTAGSLYLYDRKAADDLKKYAARAKKLRASKPRHEYVRGVLETPSKKMPESYVFVRGDFQQRGPVVQPDELTVLRTSDSRALGKTRSAGSSSGRRLAYARWLTSGRHPLAARVLVNRIWMHHFGRGIVETPADFGFLGARPRHPELLDWLADEFCRQGWSVKNLHRLIMNSTAYRQSSRRRPELEQVDSQNHLLGRMSIRRLEAEALRDTLLAISGQLVSKRFGPPVPVMADRVGRFVIGKENLNAGRPGPKIPMKGEDLRRSIYIQVRRSRPLAVLAAFDAPAMTPNCERRASSTVTPQALMLMNGDFIEQQSFALADRLRRSAGKQDVSAAIRLAWRLVYNRPATAQEVAEAVALVSAQAAEFQQQPPVSGKARKNYKQDNAQRDALSVFCQALLASNPFLYVD